MQNIAPMIESYLINKFQMLFLFGRSWGFVNQKQFYCQMLTSGNIPVLVLFSCIVACWYL